MLLLKDDQHPKTSKGTLSNAFQEGMPQSLGNAMSARGRIQVWDPRVAAERIAHSIPSAES